MVYADAILIGIIIGIIVILAIIAAILKRIFPKNKFSEKFLNAAEWISENAKI